MPSTIVTTGQWCATYPSTQIKVFRNPRGLQYYYAIISEATGLRLYKSADGETWVEVALLHIISLNVASVELYDDGTQLIVYVAYGYDESGFGIHPIYYRRLRIPDDQSDPIISNQQTVIADGCNAFPVIKRDRNGYVHIAYERNRTETIKGTDYYYGEPFIIGTTTINPDDTPSWCTPQQIDTHPDITFDSRHAKCSLVVFGGTGDIGGVCYSIRNNAGVPYIRGRDIVSYNGASYSLGTITDITAVPASLYLYFTFKVVRDNSDYAHLIHDSDVTNEKLRHRKANTSNTVESWQTYTVIDNSNNNPDRRSLALTLDRSVTPNELYAFYIFEAVETNRLRWRKTPVDTISWSDESVVQDDTVRIRYCGTSDRDYVNSLHIVYAYYGSPYTARYYELPIVVPIPPPKYSFTIPIRYIKPTVLIKRNGKIIGYRTPYTPYRPERPIQPETE